MEQIITKHLKLPSFMMHFMMTFFPFIRKYLFRKNIQKQPQEVFYKKNVLKNFAKFTVKHLCQSLCFNKVGGIACNLNKKETLAHVFPCEFCEIFMNTSFTEHLRSINDMNYEFIKNCFNFKNITDNLCHAPILSLPPAKSNCFGLYLVLFKECLVWNRLSLSLAPTAKIGENTINILHRCFSKQMYTLPHRNKCLHIGN